MAIIMIMMMVMKMVTGVTTWEGLSATLASNGSSHPVLAWIFLPSSFCYDIEFKLLVLIDCKNISPQHDCPGRPAPLPLPALPQRSWEVPIWSPPSQILLYLFLKLMSIQFTSGGLTHCWKDFVWNILVLFCLLILLLLLVSNFTFSWQTHSGQIFTLPW